MSSPGLLYDSVVVTCMGVLDFFYWFSIECLVTLPIGLWLTQCCQGTSLSTFMFLCEVSFLRGQWQLISIVTLIFRITWEMGLWTWLGWDCPDCVTRDGQTHPLWATPLLSGILDCDWKRGAEKQRGSSLPAPWCSTLSPSPPSSEVPSQQQEKEWTLTFYQ